MRRDRLILSPTKINTFLECPIKYRYVYVERIGRYYQRPKSFYSFGASLHAAIQGFHERGGPATQTPADLASHLEKSWISAGYKSPDEEQQHREQAHQMARDYFESAARRESRPILVEKPLYHNMGTFTLMGRIDRIDEWPSGELEIIDYKSGRLSVAAEDILDDLAMGVYQILTRGCYPDRQVLSTIHCLRTGVQATVEFPAEAIQETMEATHAVAEDILSRSWDERPEPPWKDACESCDFAELCRKLTARTA